MLPGSFQVAAGDDIDVESWLWLSNDRGEDLAIPMDR